MTPSRTIRTATLGSILGLLISGVSLLGAPVAGANVVCDRVVAASGSDTAPGTVAQPYASVQKLVNVLMPGETGCVRGRVVGNAKMTRGGTSTARITVTSEPGQRGTIQGRLWLATGSDNVSFTDLDLDGRNTGRLPSPLIYGNDVVFRGNDVTNLDTAICFNIGAATYEPQVTTYRTVIEGNRIHNCGIRPAANHDHGIYVEKARDVRIAGNVIYDNADRAINLYPDAQRTTIVGNIMDGNGQGVLFSGDLGLASHDNVVRGNVITNPRLREAIESWYPSGNPIGQRNLVDGNCIHGGAGTVDASGGGFTMGTNLFVDPQYVDRAAKDFRLRADSPCVEALASGTVSVPATPTEPPTSDPATSPEPLAPVVTSPTSPTIKPGRRPKAKTTATAATTTTGTRQVYLRRSRLVVTTGRVARGRVTVRVRLAGAETGRKVRARVQVRRGKRTWRTVATRTVTARNQSLRVRVPRGAGRVQIRAVAAENL